MKKIFTIIFLFITINSFSQIVINEVMYAPTSPAKEWFEIYNKTNSAVNIQNWKWKDAATSNPVRTITTQPMLIPAFGYAVVCEDSTNLKQSFPTITGIILQSSGWNALNNTGNESVVLYNSTTSVIDSLGYANTWGGSIGGFSLERIDPLAPTNLESNWGTCSDPQKGTPNKINSSPLYAPHLMLPLNGASNIQQPVILKWYYHYSAVNYWVQVATDTGFSNLVYNNDLITDTTTTLPILNLNTKYYWKVRAKDSTVFGIPSLTYYFITKPNTKPIAATLSSIYNPDAGRHLTQNYTFSSAGSYDPDGTIDSVQWFINYNKVNTGTTFTYGFPQGITFVKLLVIDNNGGRDSSTAKVTLTTFRRYLNGPVYAGLSLVGDSIIYAVGSNNKVYKMDINGNMIYYLNVNGNILSSCSISNDTSIFIGSSDNNLYGYSRYGALLWPVLSLGAPITSTPTFDSTTNRIYIGVPNGYLQVVNKTTGTIAWSSFVGFGVQSSAIITLDRKLVLFNAKGDLYGYDLNSTGTTYSWFIISNDSVTTTPALDNNGNVYIGTRGGKLKKITLPTGQLGNVVWEINLGSPVNTSPVIDGGGYIYVGLQNGQLAKVNSSNGAIIWTFNTGSSIKTDPSLSRLNRIYFGNTSGEIIALDSGKNVMWYYKDSSSIGNALLYDKGTVYAGTTTGRVLAIYDGTYMLDEPNLNPTPPMWGTFMGNNRRTGSQYDAIIGIKKIETEIPKEYFLSENYPNPYNPMTKIKYGIPTETNVKLVIYDILGKEVKIIINETQKSGVYEVTFDGSSLNSGVYFYRIQTEKYTNTKKMILIK